jgi:hypothetical protein
MQHTAPLDTAKSQISAQVSKSGIVAIGHLATALVIVAMNHGLVHNVDGTLTRSLSDICSSRFNETYPNIMSYFGWCDSDLDAKRLENTVQALEEALDDDDHWASEPNEKYLENLMDKACGIYSKRSPSAMLLDRHAKDDGIGESVVIDHAIHLAGESLMFALCADIPPCKNCHYRPFDPFKFEEHARLLRQLLQRPPRSQGPEWQQQRTTRPPGFSFCDLRKRTMEMLVPGAPNIQSTDLAVVSSGYVAFSAAIEEWDRCLTSERSIASIRLAPGPLKASQVEGTLSRLTEDLYNPALASRLVGKEHVATLYEGERCSLPR